MAEVFLERKLEKTLAKCLNRKEIIGIRGPRQSGKTTLLKKIEQELKGNKSFINLDIPENRHALEENPVDFVKRFKGPNENLFLFLDEIQKVRGAGQKLKIIFDEFPQVKTFFSGSSSLEIKSEVLPPLVGRLFLFELLSFDFEEFLKAKDKGLASLFSEKHASLQNFLESKGEISPPSFEDDFLKYWKEFSVFGGYPEVIKSQNFEEKTLILKNIYNLYLEKDIASFFRIEDTSKFEGLLRVLSFNVSKPFSLSSTASDLKTTYNKIESFLSILKHTYIIHLLEPFHKNRITELKKAQKVFFLDLGLRNAAINNFSGFDSRADNAMLLENFVFRELFSNFGNWKLNYWRTTGKAEVDFVLSREKEIVPIEVKMSGEKIGKSFYSFLQAYQPKRAIIVTLNKFKKQEINGTTLYWVPAFYF
ncbi:MAG: ATP-binding protein [Candidatus Diapherotrites archaeon]